MDVEIQDLSENDAYALFSQIIIPRPIAWVLSDNGVEHGPERWNLGPFSYFNGITSKPPMVMFSIGDGMAGKVKDTHRNLKNNPECVISLACVDQAADMQNSSEDLAPGQSETKKFNIGLSNWNWSIPRVTEAPVSMGCIARQFTRVGNTEQILVFSEITRLWVRDDVGTLDTNGQLRIDVKAFNPLARVGKGAYARLSEIFRV
ncbi:MAG: protein/domain typically associated with flavoprotein oxygenase, DIM6/NTAB family protein [Rhodospirillaceae bacterium]|nr:protein/domain typically associated with flavoprotein oxygenase, DIM6/NTAB family protein [Rhodospirillaceae bacterium]